MNLSIYDYKPFISFGENYVKKYQIFSLDGDDKGSFKKIDPFTLYYHLPHEEWDGRVPSIPVVDDRSVGFISFDRDPGPEPYLANWLEYYEEMPTAFKRQTIFTGDQPPKEWRVGGYMSHIVCKVPGSSHESLPLLARFFNTFASKIGILGASVEPYGLGFFCPHLVGDQKKNVLTIFGRLFVQMEDTFRDLTEEESEIKAEYRDVARAALWLLGGSWNLFSDPIYPEDSPNNVRFTLKRLCERIKPS